MTLQAYTNSDMRYYCKTSPVCCKSPTISQITNAIVDVLKNVELPRLESQVRRNNGDAKKIRRNLLDQAHKQLDELNAQEQKQYELLEKGIYSEEVFEQRNKALKEKKLALMNTIQETMDNIPEQVDYREKVVMLKNAIKELEKPNTTAEKKNKLLKAVVDRIDYYADKTQPRNEHKFTIDITMNI